MRGSEQHHQAVRALTSPERTGWSASHSNDATDATLAENQGLGDRFRRADIDQTVAERKAIPEEIGRND
jgi:hypothetical protein